MTNVLFFFFFLNIISCVRRFLSNYLFIPILFPKKSFKKILLALSQTIHFFLKWRIKRCWNESLLLSVSFLSLQLNAVWYSQSQSIYKKVSLGLPNSDAPLQTLSTRTVRHSRSGSVINIMLHANSIPSEVSLFSGECLAWQQIKNMGSVSTAVTHLICPVESNMDLLLELLCYVNTYTQSP